MKWLFVGLTLALGCITVPDEVDVNVNLDVEPCLTCFPECAVETGEYSCSGASTNCEECAVGCLAGKYILCTETGPECLNDFMDSDTTAPVICVKEE